jgi:hypothetical protein
MTHSSLDPTALYGSPGPGPGYSSGVQGSLPGKGFCSQEWSTIFHVYEGPTQHLFGN